MTIQANENYLFTPEDEAAIDAEWARIEAEEAAQEAREAEGQARREAELARIARGELTATERKIAKNVAALLRQIDTNCGWPNRKFWNLKTMDLCRKLVRDGLLRDLDRHGFALTAKGARFIKDAAKL